MPDDLFLIADSFTVGTIIGNLINNAIKFTPEYGLVKISATETDHQTELWIEDNGVEMGNETIANLFKIDESTSTLGTNNEIGTGLGLLLCKEFIVLNKASIEVKSKLGKGTLIKLIFPKTQV